jgi:PAS domain S-box-containing protein
MQGRFSLQERLVVLVVAAILPLSALSVWLTLREVSAATRLAQSQLKFAASLIAANQDRAVESAQQLLAGISAMPGLKKTGRARCQSYFESLRSRFPAYSNIGLISLDGMTFCHANGGLRDFSAADRLYFRDAVSQRSFVMGEAVQGRAAGQWTLPFAMPVLEAGQVTGVVFAALDLGRAASALAGIAVPEGAQVTVADRHGRVLMDQPPDPALAAPYPLAHAELQAARSMNSGVGEGPDRTGELRIYAFAPSRLVGNEGFVVRVGLSRAGVLDNNPTALHQILLFALALLVGVVGAWRIGGRVIVKPAMEIIGAVRRLERGDLSARIPLRGGRQRGEFAEVAATFNLMAESLQLRQLDLQAELGRSRNAYAVLDLVINSMQAGVVAVDGAGQFMMFNEAAARLFPLHEPAVSPQHWPRHFGLYQPDGQALCDSEDLPAVRALRGETGDLQLVARNRLTPQGRLLQCSYRPMRGDGDFIAALLVFVDITDIQKAEADLVLLRKAVARLNDIVLITEADQPDTPGPRIVFVNEAFERLTGYTAQEAIGNTTAMLYGPATDQIKLAGLRSTLARGQPARQEVVHYARDGRELWLELDVVPMAGDSGSPTHFIAVLRDITARKESERALMESERELQDFTQMLQSMAEAAQDIAGRQSLQETMQAAADRARQVIGAHQAMLRLTADGEARPATSAVSLSPGCAMRSDLPAMPEPCDIHAAISATGRPLRLAHVDLIAHPRWRDFSAHTAANPVPGGLLAVRLVNRDGRDIGLLLLSGKEAGEFNERDEYVAVEMALLASVAIENARLFQEILELNAGLESRIADRTAELSRQELLYRTLAEQAPEVIWNADARGNRLTFLNRAWYELVGGTPEDWLGKSGRSAIHPDDLAEVSANWRRSCEARSTFTGVRRLRARDGSYHIMSCKAVPVLDDAGEVAFWIGIDTDITAFKAIEQALRSSNQELEAFSYSVSHDLRAPLSAISGFSQALAHRLEGQADERTRHFLARIRAGVAKMEERIDALLSLAKVVRAPLKYGPVDFTAMAREMLDGLHEQDPAREVRVTVQEALMAQGDAGLLRGALENLLSNAWKFTSRRSGAEIEVGRQDGNVFFVRDNGVGFDMAYADKLFGVFQRLHTEAEFPGSGIGLATARRIVVRHQGRVWAESVLGEGTTFFFALSESPPPAWLGESGRL